MNDVYVFDYVNENEFKKLERSLKKYNMLAYKKLYFSYYPELKKGNLLGEVMSVDAIDGSVHYEVKLPTDVMFAKVHGDIKLHYILLEDQKKILLDKITPEDILSEGHQSELVTYKGVMVSRQHSDKDLFKINLMNMINNKE